MVKEHILSIELNGAATRGGVYLIEVAAEGLRHGANGHARVHGSDRPRRSDLLRNDVPVRMLCHISIMLVDVDFSKIE